MKHPLHQEPLTTITVDGKTIPVVSLPQEIQNQIGILGILTNEYVDAAFALEKADILLKVKKAQVEQLIKDALKPASKPAPEPEVD